MPRSPPWRRCPAPARRAAGTALATELFSRATEREQGFLRGLVLGDLRQGAMDALVQEGMARAYAVDPAVLRRAAMLLSSTTEAAELLVSGGAEALAAVGLTVGTPMQPMLAASAPGSGDALSQVRRAGRDRRRQARRHPGAGAPPRRRRLGVHPVPGRHHRAAAGGGGGGLGRSPPTSWCSTARCWRCGPTDGRRRSSWWRRGRRPAPGRPQSAPTLPGSRRRPPPEPTRHLQTSGRRTPPAGAPGSPVGSPGVLLRPAARERPYAARRGADRARGRARAVGATPSCGWSAPP